MRDGMSRLVSSRNVQWSAEGAAYSLYSWAYNLVNVCSLRSGNFDERTKKLNKCFYEKMYFWQKPKASYFMAETSIVQKVAYILASLRSEKKISYKLEKIQKNFFITLFARKKSRRKGISTSLLA